MFRLSSIFRFLYRFRPFTARGSIFVKIAQVEDKVLEARGRIVAIDAANTAKEETVKILRTESTRVHAGTDKITNDLDEILSTL